LEYEDFVLSVTPSGSGEIGLATSGPLQGDSRGTSRFPFSPEEWSRLYAVLAEEEWATPLSAAEIKIFGAKLFAALFPEPILRALERIETRLEGDAGRRLRIRLQLDVRDPEALRFASLPWELAYSLERGSFLFLGGKISLVRHLEIQRGIRPPLEGNLRILIASAEPRGVPSLDLESEIRAVRETINRVPQVELLEPLYRATAQSLRDALVQNAPVHVLHFLGHSDFDPETGEGCLLLEGAHHEKMPLPAHRLANLLRDHESLRLAVLNACWSGRATDRTDLDPFAGLASALVRDGVPAVVAMQFPVRDSAACIFSEKLYEQLAKNASLDAAVAEGRLAIQTVAAEAGGSPVSWAIPALYARSQDGRLFQHGFSPETSPEAVRSEILSFATLIRDRTAGFVGRRWLSERIDSFVQEHDSGFFLIRGDPGIGKTALMAQRVKQFRNVHHFNQRGLGVNTTEACHRSLCAQLIQTYGLSYPVLPPNTGLDGRILMEMLETSSEKLAPGERGVLLIDALNEADPSVLRGGSNVLYLPPLLPPGFFAILTTQREDLNLDLKGPLEEFHLDPHSAENQCDVRDLILARIERPGIQAYLSEWKLGIEAFIMELAAKSEGNFLYLRLILDDLEAGNLGPRPFDELPAGLLRYYEDLWVRMRQRYEAHWTSAHLPLIGVLALIDAPVSASTIAAATRSRDLFQLRDTLGKWAPFLQKIASIDEKGKKSTRFRLYHDSFKEFLREKSLSGCEEFRLEDSRHLLTDHLELSS